MCGIVGIASVDGRTPVDPARLARMRDRLTHRGPDGAGVWVDGPVGLGHRRLAIIDVEGGHQPMTNEDGSVWVVFNGEIYNHAELRPDLIARGHVYRTRSDTETILHLYDEYGDAGLERLEGMYALALWDRRRGRLLLARDRLGIKPLYVAQTAREILFASEIKALLGEGVTPEFNEAALGEFLANRYVAGRATCVRHVEALEPAHTLSWSAGRGVRVRRYWRLPAPAAGSRPLPPPADPPAALRRWLREAVQRHLMSDVPLGVFLSGGLDSSALAAVAAQLVPDPIQTFSVGFQEAEGNELPFAREVAAAIGAEHHEVTVTPAQYFGALPYLVSRQDQPMAFSSGVPLYFVSRLAQQRGVKVVLTGEGADELFLGYNRYRVALWNQRFGRVYRALVPGALRGAVRRAIDGLPHRFRRYPSRTFLAGGATTRDGYFDNFSVFSERQQAALLVRPDGAGDPYLFGQRCYDEAGGGARDRMSAADLQTYLVELLMKQDRMSMAASIESRVPFLDDRLVARVMALPAALKLRAWRTKAVLRDAVAGLLPESILTRPKMGFPVPLARWLRGPYLPVVEEFVLGARARARGYFRPEALRRLAEEHREGAVNHAERLWLLITLEIWQRVCCDGECPADVMRPVWRRLGMRYASGVDQDGWAVAPQHWRPAAYVPDPVAAVGAAFGHARHNARP